MIVPLHPRFGRRSLSLADILAQREDWLLAETFSLRVASWSMFPTLLKGDRLILGPADSIEAGDLIVYESAGVLCCHRAVQAGPDDRWLLRGDATEGEGHSIAAALVRGKVVEIRRGRRRFVPATPPPPHWSHRARRRRDEQWYRISEAGRSFARSCLIRVTRLSIIQRILFPHLFVCSGSYPSTLEARLGPLVLATLHQPTGTIIRRSWTEAFPLEILFHADVRRSLRSS